MFKNDDDCNTCWCGQDGKTVSRTDKQCETIKKRSMHKSLFCRMNIIVKYTYERIFNNKTLIVIDTRRPINLFVFSFRQ